MVCTGGDETEFDVFDFRKAIGDVSEVTFDIGQHYVLSVFETLLGQREQKASLTTAGHASGETVVGERLGFQVEGFSVFEGSDMQRHEGDNKRDSSPVKVRRSKKSPFIWTKIVPSG